MMMCLHFNLKFPYALLSWVPSLSPNQLWWLPGENILIGCVWVYLLDCGQGTPTSSMGQATKPSTWFFTHL